MKRIDRFASDANLDVYALGKDKAKWDMRLEAYTEAIVMHCVYKFGQTRMEPILEKYIMESLKNES
jgi:hypothetical protein